MRQISVIPRAPLARVLFSAGAKRVAKPATDAFVEVLTKFAEDIASKAVQISKHSGRKTVQEGDVKLASK